MMEAVLETAEATVILVMTTIDLQILDPWTEEPGGLKSQTQLSN